jgi:hypothetical protein
MAACRERGRVLAVETSGRSGPMLDGEDRHLPGTGGYGMRQSRIIRQRRRATTGRRQVAGVQPLDPRDPEVIRAKQVQRRARAIEVATPSAANATSVLFTSFSRDPAPTAPTQMVR